MFSVKFIFFGVLCVLLAVVLYASVPILTLILGLFALAMFGGAAWSIIGTRRAAQAGKAASAEAQPETLPEDAPFRADDVIWRFEREWGEHLDGTRDETGVSWLQMTGGQDLRGTLDALIAAKTAAKGAYFLLSNRKRVLTRALTMLRIPAEREAEALGDDREELVRLCDENSIRILVEEENYRFRELTHGYRYALSMKEYAGSADDAATYGLVELDQLKEH